MRTRAAHPFARQGWRSHRESGLPGRQADGCGVGWSTSDERGAVGGVLGPLSAVFVRISLDWHGLVWEDWRLS